MNLWVRSGIIYCLAVFVLAFALGTVRVLWVTPRVGPVIAVLLETPLVLLAGWIVARRVLRGAPDGDMGGRVLMGALAFILLMALEFGLGDLLGRPIGDQLAGMGTPAGVIGLAGQVVFAAIPALQGLWGRRREGR